MFKYSLKTVREHVPSRSCQCKRCVQLYTITMQDREFLRIMGIAWIAKK